MTREKGCDTFLRKRKKGENDIGKQKKQSKAFDYCRKLLGSACCGVCRNLWRFYAQRAGGSKTIGLTVTFAQDNQKEYTIHTDAENLGDALKEEKLVEGTQGEYGLYIETVDGVTADAANRSGGVLPKMAKCSTPVQI